MNKASPKERSRDRSVYVIIFLVVIVFNLIAVFGLNILLHDDPAWYEAVLENKFPTNWMKHNLLIPFTEWIAWNVMVYSADLARALYVLIFMVPISWSFYYLLRFKFGLSRSASLTASVLPNILPWQWQIPAGINMSYVLWVLFFFLFSMILGLNYLEKNGPRNWMRFFGAVALFMGATQIAEQAIFLFPPMIFALWGFKKLKKKSIRLISSLTFVAALRGVQMVVFPRKSVFRIPFEEISERFALYFKWSLPSPNIDPIYLMIVFLIIVTSGFFLYLFSSGANLKPSSNFSHFTKKQFLLFFFSIFICWSVCTVIFTILMSDPYTPRYTYISSFGVNVIFIFSIYALLSRKRYSKFKLHYWAFLIIIVFSGTSRYARLKADYSKRNETRSILVKDLETLQLPLNSQLVITGVEGIHAGWRRASGYLKHILKRDDINGLIGPILSSPYYNFDDHFDPKQRGWGLRWNMTGLSIHRPLFLFTLEKGKTKLKQLEYALQWKGNEMNAAWVIFKGDRFTGKVSPFLSGSGMGEYLSVIKELEIKGIAQSDILWGGPPSPIEQERLTGRLQEPTGPVRQGRSDQL
jgi:hypothetical protein